MRFKEKTVVVTGASSGIGRQTAAAFAKEGARVAVTARRRKELEMLCREAPQDGGVMNAYSADVRDFDKIKEIFECITEDFGRIDIVVHCAGMTVKGAVQEMETEDWDQVLDTNLKSTYFVARTAHEYLKRNEEEENAKFIAIGSVGTYLGIPLSAAYCASKGGVVQLIRAMAAEWASQHINVNAVCPGYVRTPLSEGVLKIGQTYNKVVSRIPMGYIGSTDDVAQAILFLASRQADYITGTTLNVDGGLLSAAYTMD